MQLSQPEALGVLDDHDARLRHVDADFDHRGRDQDARRALGKARHRRVFLRPAHAAVDEFDRVAEALLQGLVTVLGGGEVDGFRFLDQRAHPIDAAAVVERAAHRLDHFAEPLQRQRAGVDLLPPGGLFAQLGHVHVAEVSEHQSARDRSSRQHQRSTASPFRASASR